MLKILSFIISINVLSGQDVPIKIEVTEPAAVVNDEFLSVTIDSYIVKAKFKNINLASKKLLTLANGLTPHGATPEVYLRIGGSDADHVIFDPTMYILNITEINLLCTFAEKLGWKLIFDLNSLLRQRDGSWNSANAVELIDYLEAKYGSIHYELGNEPDLFPKYDNITIPPKQLAKDFRTLRGILNEKTGGKSMLLGPDVATITRSKYFANFLSNISEDVLSAVTFHHYYSSSKHITSKNFTDVKYLDRFLTYGLKALSIIKSSFSTFPHPPVWIGETSSTYEGGVAGLGESFSAGFLWLDKLGLAAQMNISVVIRQSLRGGAYSLINKYYDPSPDYWSSVLYKQMMGRTVLGVTGYLEYNRQVRIYAHCVNKFSGRGYRPSSLVLMVLNLHHLETAKIRFVMVGWEGYLADLYLLQPANGNLTDKHVTLNGKLLEMVDDTTLPELKPIRIAQPYDIAPLSYGFLVILNSTVPACKYN